MSNRDLDGLGPRELVVLSSVLGLRLPNSTLCTFLLFLLLLRPGNLIVILLFNMT